MVGGREHERADRGVDGVGVGAHELAERRVPLGEQRAAVEQAARFEERVEIDLVQLHALRSKRATAAS